MCLFCLGTFSSRKQWLQMQEPYFYLNIIFKMDVPVYSGIVLKNSDTSVGERAALKAVVTSTFNLMV